MNTKPRNWTYRIAVTIVYTFLIAAAAGSFTDIVKCAHMLGLHWQAWTVPALLDGVALMGKLGRSQRFADRTRRAGLRLMVFGGLLSLAANVAAGDNAGQRVYGALLVIGFLLVEWYAGHLAPAAVDEPVAQAVTVPAQRATEPVPAPVEVAPVSARSAAASRGWETRRRREAEAVKAEQAAVRAARRALAGE